MLLAKKKKVDDIFILLKIWVRFFLYEIKGKLKSTTKYSASK